MERAPFWLRMASLGIDVVIFTTLQGIASTVAYLALRHVPTWVPAIVGVVYLATEVAFSGTPAKLILGLRVRRADGAVTEPARRVLPGRPSASA